MMRDYLQYREDARQRKRPPKLPPVVWYILGVVTLVFAVIRIYQLIAGRL